MTDSGERESSFEVLEEPSDSYKVPSLVQDVGPLSEMVSDTASSDESLDHCPDKDSDASKGHETQSILDLSISDISFAQDSSCEAVSNLELPSSFTLCNRKLSLEQPKNQRRIRAKYTKRLFRKYRNVIAADLPSRIPLQRTFALSAAVVVGMFLALIYVFLKNSYHMSHLVEELNSVHLQHARDLLRESRRCPDQVGFIRNMSLEHQLERQNWELEVHSLSQQLKARDAELEKLLQESRSVKKKLELDLLTLSGRYREQLVASEETIMELRSERQKLMDAAFSAKSTKKLGKTDCLETKSENDKLKQQMKHLLKELKRLKAAFLDLQERSVFIPGWHHISRIFCKLFRLCPELAI